MRRYDHGGDIQPQHLVFAQHLVRPHLGNQGHDTNIGRGCLWVFYRYAV